MELPRLLAASNSMSQRHSPRYVPGISPHRSKLVNTFCEHHKNSIKFGYRCFDRILLNGLIQPFQQPERVIGFFNAYREGQRVTRKLLSGIADQFQNFVKDRAVEWNVPIVEAPKGRRDEFVDPYFKGAG